MMKNVLLGTVAVLLIGVAMYRFFRGKAEDAPPSGGLTFVCSRCNLKFEVTYAEWDRITNDRRLFKVPDQHTKTLLIKCPKCNDFTAHKYEEPEPPPPEGATPPPQ